MRIYGRTYDLLGNATWHEITTDADGMHDSVYLTALAQDLQLNLGESPFFAANGIPAQQSVVTQVFPDYYAMLAQSQYSGYFASLVINRVPQSTPPVYNVRAVTNKGAILGADIPI
ncbi:MAG: hypothetical protein B7X71_10585 [Polynucleobacter sp. 39-46-10]|nr:MAG: hypothetical protein B7X71_10585 [Polynucleobacter sp. 39-46-10]